MTGMQQSHYSFFCQSVLLSHRQVTTLLISFFRFPFTTCVPLNITVWADFEHRSQAICSFVFARFIHVLCGCSFIFVAVWYSVV